MSKPTRRKAQNLGTAQFSALDGHNTGEHDGRVNAAADARPCLGNRWFTTRCCVTALQFQTLGCKIQIAKYMSNNNHSDGKLGFCKLRRHQKPRRLVTTIHEGADTELAKNKLQLLQVPCNSSILSCNLESELARKNLIERFDKTCAECLHFTPRTLQTNIETNSG